MCGAISFYEHNIRREPNGGKRNVSRESNKPQNKEPLHTSLYEGVLKWRLAESNCGHEDFQSSAEQFPRVMNQLQRGGTNMGTIFKSRFRMKVTSWFDAMLFIVFRI